MARATYITKVYGMMQIMGKTINGRTVKLDLEKMGFEGTADLMVRLMLSEGIDND